MNPTCQILIGNCLELLRTLPEESVHCVITSPPYWGLRDYKLPPTHWPEVTFSPMPGLPAMTIPAQDAVHGLEPELLAYVAHEVAVFREVKRVLRSDGALFLNLGDAYSSQWACKRRSIIGLGSPDKSVERGRISEGLKEKDLCGIPWRVAFAMQADGWYLRQDIIRANTNPMPESIKDRCTKSHEYLFLLTKAPRYYFDAEAIKELVSGTANARKAKERVFPAGWGIGDEPRTALEFQQAGIHPKTKANGPNSRMVRERAAGREDSKPNPSRGHIPGVGPKSRPAGSGIKNNESYSAAMVEMPAKRNKRSVWHISSEPCKDAHFATFPQALIEPCILAGTSERGVCPKCGAPWGRETKKERPPLSVFTKTSNPLDELVGSGSRVGGVRYGHGQKLQDWIDAHPPVTTGWQSGCDCPTRSDNSDECDFEPPEPVPGTVLDPFGGSGTTALTANRLGRSAIIIELNPDYVGIACKRNSQRALL